MSVSAGYKKTLVEMHASRDWGIGGKAWAPLIRSRITAQKAVSLLDYGCGQGTLGAALSEQMPGFDIREFDPGIPGKDGKPAPADIVTATDVLEHVEPKELERTLRQLRDLTQKEMFLMIACKPAKAVLPDGRNAHLIVESPEWWVKRLDQVIGWPTIVHEQIYRKSKRLVISLIRP